MPQSGSWLPAYQSIWTHRKTFELAAQLGTNETYAAAHVLRLCAWALDNAPDGDLSNVSDRAIAYGAGWHQEVSLFVTALVKSGYLEESRQIHDWFDYAGKLLVRREKDAERKQKSRGPAPDVTRTSNGSAHDIRRREEKRTEEKNTEENPTPQPPPQAEGAMALTEATDDDTALWERARAALTDGWLPANVEKVWAFDVLGRGPDGGLRLRAPPWARPAVSPHQLRAALSQAGDAAGAHAQIVPGGGHDV